MRLSPDELRDALEHPDGDASLTALCAIHAELHHWNDQQDRRFAKLDEIEALRRQLQQQTEELVDLARELGLVDG